MLRGCGRRWRSRTLRSEVAKLVSPGFTVYVDRPPASMGEAMVDIQGHFRKILETAKDVSVLLEVVPYQRRVQPPVLTDDGKEQGAPEVPPEPFELFQSHKESLDRLYEWEKRLYEEVRAGEKVRLAYEKKCALLRSQDANGAEPFAIEKTRAAVRDLRTKPAHRLSAGHLFDDLPAHDHSFTYVPVGAFWEEMLITFVSLAQGGNDIRFGYDSG